MNLWWSHLWMKKLFNE
ncbi:hypothetical protein Gogos_022111 [Gossypium gossypioides]|uniref:Uncharacterized protein n=1 Tax=Gossypium gossypioides TaxID=34282 RepID=A0A7J9D084_GOSGO|nr:hypothetical protein [Gossypium gossypioides]